MSSLQVTILLCVHGFIVMSPISQAILKFVPQIIPCGLLIENLCFALWVNKVLKVIGLVKIAMTIEIPQVCIRLQVQNFRTQDLRSCHKKHKARHAVRCL